MSSETERLAIRIIQDDLREFSRSGRSVVEYSEDDAMLAMINGGLRPSLLSAPPDGLVMVALQELCERALLQ